MIPSLMPNYARVDVAFEKGEGVYLFDSEGRRYLDFGGGIAVNSLGHCHPHLVEALKSQVETLWHCSNLYRIPGQEKLAQRLVDNTFADSVFFANSGAEAVECGLKMIRKYHDDKGDAGRYRVITCTGGFHGRTLATIAAGGQAKHLSGFDPVVDGFDHVSFGNLNEMRAAIGDETGAILVEPVQGEGGIHTAVPEYLQGLREIADEFGLLLMIDEVQTGVGRTGKFFAHEWTGIVPDIMAIAKGLGGGFPIGACLAVEKVAHALTPGSHGSTFGGNPLAMAASNAVLDVVLADGFLGEVDRLARILWTRTRGLATAYPGIIADVRGAGLMVGLKCTGNLGQFIARAMENGLLLVPAADNVARLLPPLIISEAHIDEALGILEKTCVELGAGLGGEGS
ncbi:MAG: aspartate aminotransferase family protein [Rhodospirillales bacterium]|nr:aspartate aminotransferase family protein [Rhodospirillales bacterium]